MRGETHTSGNRRQDLEPAEVEMFGIIYKAAHTPSGRVYVGQTYSRKHSSSDELLNDRKKRHIRSATGPGAKKTHFAWALLKYGIDQFEWAVVDTADSIEELNRLESHYIHLFRSSSELNGFNSRLEGDNVVFTIDAKRQMAQSALTRWHELSPDERTRLTERQKKGRAARPELRTLYSQQLKRLRSTEGFNEKRAANLAAAVRSPEFREKRSEISKRRWETVSAEEKKRVVDAMLSAPDRLARQLEKMQTEEYRKNLTAANRARRKRPFVVVAVESGDVVSKFENVVDAARLLQAFESNISAALRGRAKAFKAKNPDYARFGKLTARWLDDMRPIEKRYEATRKSVDILTAGDGRLVASFRGVRVANAALGADIGSVLAGRTSTFRAKMTPYRYFGPLVARWAQGR